MTVCTRPEIAAEGTGAKWWRKLQTARPWLERLLCLAAVIGLGLTLVNDFEHVKTVSPIATDYKTVYASSALFARGSNPYDMAQIERMYRESGVVLPENMFGHMPVYPPVTLLVLWPLAKLSMAQSAIVWLVLSIVAAAAALIAVLSEAREQGLGWGYRLALVAFTVSAPVLGYALDIGNVSPAVAALATVALMVAVRESQNCELDGLWPAEMKWRRILGAGLCLGLALCLKPHMAVWIAVAVALVCGRPGRWIAAVGSGVFAACGLAALAVLADRGQVRTVLASLLDMLRSERGGGSMAPTSHEVLTIGAQITGLDSLLAWWLRPEVREIAVVAVLVALLGGLVLAAWRAGWRSWDPSWQVLFAMALFATGMLASYHRAHDAVLLPAVAGLWICQAVRRAVAGWRRWTYWGGASGILCLLAAQWFGVAANVRKSIGAWTGISGIQDFLELRQAAAAMACLAVLLVVLAVKLGEKSKKDGTDREIRAGRPVTQLVSDGAYGHHRSENMSSGMSLRFFIVALFRTVASGILH